MIQVWWVIMILKLANNDIKIFYEFYRMIWTMKHTNNDIKELYNDKKINILVHACEMYETIS